MTGKMNIVIGPASKFVSAAEACAPGPFRGYFKTIKAVAFPPPQKKLGCSSIEFLVN